MSTVVDGSQEQYETNRLRVKNNERDNSISTGQEITPSSESSNMTSLTNNVTKQEQAPQKAQDFTVKDVTEYTKDNSNNFATGQEIIPNNIPPVDQITRMMQVIKGIADSERINPSSQSTLEKVSEIADSIRKNTNEKDITPEVKSNLQTIEESIKKIANSQKIRTNAKTGIQPTLDKISEVANSMLGGISKQTNSKPIPTKRANSLSIIKNSEGKPDLELTISESLNNAFPDKKLVDTEEVKQKMADIIKQTFEAKLFPVTKNTKVKAVNNNKK